MHYGILTSIKYYYLHSPTGGSRPFFLSGVCNFLCYQKIQPTCHPKVRVIASSMRWCVWCYKQQWIFYLLPPFSLSSHRDSPHPTTNKSFPPIYFSFSYTLYSFDFFSFPFIIFDFIWLLYQTQSSLSWFLIFYIIFIIISF
jgi:hypothetical protein